MEKRKFFRRQDIERDIYDYFGDMVFPGERQCVKEASEASFAVLGNFGTSWKTVEPASVLFNDEQSVEVLSQDGFRFFFPAFLLVSFDNLKEIAEYGFFVSLVTRLEEDFQGDISGFWDRGRRKLTASVLEAVAQDTEDPEMRGRIDHLARLF